MTGGTTGWHIALALPRPPRFGRYNKEHTMSPFAGLAFNPFDGIIQVRRQLCTLRTLCRAMRSHFGLLRPALRDRAARAAALRLPACTLPLHSSHVSQQAKALGRTTLSSGLLPSSSPPRPAPQAISYSIFLFFVPMHFLTHELLLFATGVWTCNIHDNLHGDVFPIMGAPCALCMLPALRCAPCCGSTHRAAAVGQWTAEGWVVPSC